MTKFAPIFMLAIAILLSACGNGLPESAPADSPVPTAAVDSDAQTDSSVPPTEHAVPTEQDGSLDASDREPADAYMADVESQAEQIESALNEAMTQTEMTAAAGRLYTLWDKALNHLWAELKVLMPEEQFSVLLDEQLVWIAEKEKALEESGKQVEGGSIYAMTISLHGAQITRERVYELYELLKQTLN